MELIYVILGLVVLGIAAAAVAIYLDEEKHAPLKEQCIDCHKWLTDDDCHEVVEVNGTDEDDVLKPGEGWAVSVAYCQEHCPGGCTKERA